MKRKSFVIFIKFLFKLLYVWKSKKFLWICYLYEISRQCEMEFLYTIEEFRLQ